jgi:hypothetical protein
MVRMYDSDISGLKLSAVSADFLLSVFGKDLGVSKQEVFKTKRGSEPTEEHNRKIHTLLWTSLQTCCSSEHQLICLAVCA